MPITHWNYNKLISQKLHEYSLNLELWDVKYLMNFVWKIVNFYMGDYYRIDY